MRITCTALLCLALIGCGGESTSTDINAEAKPAQTLAGSWLRPGRKTFPVSV